MPILELKQIRKRLGGQSVLKGVDLSLEEGEVVVILGPSGSGKTTLLRTINFLNPADSGTLPNIISAAWCSSCVKKRLWCFKITACLRTKPFCKILPMV